MAKDLEDGYTRIANEVLEDCARCKFLCNKSRVLFAVFRNTYGRQGHPKEWKLTATYLAEATGLPLGSVKNTLMEMKSDGTIIRNGSMTGYQKYWIEKSPIDDGHESMTVTDPLPQSHRSVTKTVTDSLPNKERKERKTKKDSTTAKRTVISEDFQLSTEMQNFAVQKGMFGEIIETEFEKFKAYHGAKGSLMKKWDLAWHTWVLNWRRYNQGAGKVDKYLKVKSPVETAAEKLWGPNWKEEDKNRGN
jgi:phage replication O-like protein O